MKPTGERCARTDAVLAVHLDGDFTSGELAPSRGGDPTAADHVGWGWDFVCGESLREHLAACIVCQRALQRARRLDAALAADAGRAVADALTADHGATDHDAADRSLDELGRRLCERAMQRASDATPAASAAFNADRRQRPPATHRDVPHGATRHCSTRHSSTSLPSTRLPSPPGDVALRAPLTGMPDPSRLGSWLAATLLGAAAMTAWWLLLGHRPPTPSQTPTGAVAIATMDVASGDATRGTDDSDSDSGADSDSDSDSDSGADDHATTAPAPGDVTAFPLDAARRFARARQRDDDAEHGPTPERLAATLADRDATSDRRITAGAQLAQLSRASTRSAKACTDALLRALAGCGDANEAELEVQRTLLSQLRTAPLDNVLLERLRPLLAEEAIDGLATTAGTPDLTPDLGTTAALVVALRAGGERLDAALRRVLRERHDLDAIVTQALRCPTRDDGGAHFLLTCWQDRVAAGHQADTAEAAQHWFAGMSPATFATVRQVLETSRSAPERVRCLLALGCVGDDSTTACLLSTLRSGRGIEACAASAALSSLPHDALRPLVPLARRGGSRRIDGRSHEDALLRLALCRAGLDEAAPWLAALDLTDRQRDQLRDAPLTRLTEIAGWFREGAVIAD